MVSGGFAACEGNLDCDKDTDGADLALFAADFGASGCSTCDDVITRMNELESRIAYLEDLLDNVSRAIDTTYPTIRFSGVNVQIVDGSDTTGGSTNGLGNLIVGYNEERGSGDVRTGSHNIIVGVKNNYSAYGGIVAGSNNSITGSLATITGGYSNTASGTYSSVSGGDSNTASGTRSCVNGGRDNTVAPIGSYATVTGGRSNEAVGDSATVAGGRGNYARGDYSFVGGGGDEWDNGNAAYGEYSSIVGGNMNRTGNSGTTQGKTATVTGGWNNAVVGEYDWAGGNCTFCDE